MSLGAMVTKFDGIPGFSEGGEDDKLVNEEMNLIFTSRGRERN